MGQLLAKILPDIVCKQSNEYIAHREEHEVQLRLREYFEARSQWDRLAYWFASLTSPLPNLLLYAE